MYGNGRRVRFFIGLALVIALLFLIISMIVRSGGDDKKTEVPETQRTFVSLADDEDVTVTRYVVGPITAAEKHYETEIQISNTTATANVISGYEGTVTDTRSYPTTREGFSEFLYALDKVGFTNGNTDEALRDDEGYCSSGQRYIYEVRDDGKLLQRFWATSCGGTKTYKGKLGQTNNIFENQIPDYKLMTNSLGFRSSAFSFN